MSQPKRHPSHPWQQTFFEGMHERRSELSYSRLAPKLRRWVSAASPALLSGLFSGDTGATGTEVFALMEAFGLDTAAEVLAQMAGRTLAPKLCQSGDTIASCGAAIAQAAGALVSRAMVALADGVADEVERADLRALALRLRDLSDRLLSVVDDERAA